MKELMNKIGFVEEETAFFTELFSTLPDTVFKEFDDLKSKFFTMGTDESNSEACSYVNDRLVLLSESIGCHKFSLYLLFLLYCCDALKVRYENAGIDLKHYYNLIGDITCKLRECRQVHNIMGTSSFNWFHKHFILKLFALGRFQYVEGAFRHDKEYCCGDVCVKPGDSVYYIHIPSTGSMPEEQRLASYKEAFDFLGTNHGEYIIFVCDSWLLYPGNKCVFPENSNLMGFLNDFDIISTTEPDEPFRNAWRVFYRDYDGDTSVLPKDTTLQKNYIKWLDTGNKVGNGYGIIVFDGEKIVNKKNTTFLYQGLDKPHIQ